MKPPKWWLRWKLRHAARLLRRGIINRWQYSALAIKLGYGIWGKPLSYETRLSGDEVRALVAEASGR